MHLGLCAQAIRPHARSFAIIVLAILAGFAIALCLPQAAYAEGEAISGRIVVTQTDKPISDVRITITDAAGLRVASVTTKKDGRFRVAVPGPGTYTVTIDPKTLPKNVELVDKTKTSKEVQLTAGNLRAVAFRVTDGSSLDPTGGSKIPQLLFEGLRFGLLIAVAAIGASLIFGTTGLTNFAHGELVALGAFAAWVFNSGLGMPLWLATVFAVAIGSGLGAGNELGIWRPLRRLGVGLIASLIASIGVMILLRHVLLISVGGGSESYDVPAQVEREYGAIAATDRDLLVMGICVVVLVGVALLLQKTRIGTAMRAVSDNRDLAASSGIDVDRVILFVWVLAGALAALGGVLYGWTLDLRYDMGFQLLLMMFAGITLGGLGTAYGALVGSILIGIIVQLSTLFLPSDVKYAAGLVVLIAVLLIRPSGILGAKQRVG